MYRLPHRRPRRGCPVGTGDCQCIIDFGDDRKRQWRSDLGTVGEIRLVDLAHLLLVRNQPDARPSNTQQSPHWWPSRPAPGCGRAPVNLSVRSTVSLARRFSNLALRVGPHPPSRGHLCVCVCGRDHGKRRASSRDRRVPSVLLLTIASSCITEHVRGTAAAAAAATTTTTHHSGLLAVLLARLGSLTRQPRERKAASLFSFAHLWTSWPRVPQTVNTTKQGARPIDRIQGQECTAAGRSGMSGSYPGSCQSCI